MAAIYVQIVGSESNQKGATMSDLIYREALLAEYDKHHVGAPGMARKLIADAPTIDAVPVVHGRWVHTDMAAWWFGKDECSECQYHDDERNDLSRLKYCPNCGAKMDGEA